MITLYLAIYKGDVQRFKFDSVDSLLEYLEELKRFDCIWLATNDVRKPDKCEIMITEKIDKILLSIQYDYWDMSNQRNYNFSIQEYQTYETAYSVALSMREGNPKCYN